MNGLYATLINLVAYIVILIILYKIIKGIIHFFKGIAGDVKYTTDKMKEKKERKDNIPIIVEDIIKSIEQNCPDFKLIDHIDIVPGYDDFFILLKDGKQLTYSSYRHGFDVQNYKLIEEALALRLNFSIEPIMQENASDQGYHIEGYRLLSKDAVKRKQELLEKERNRIKV